uniref:Uncharacterized protein n=1 Tax=Setaria italica TaxID=4555 RepID=K3XP07_SETIT
MDVDRIYKGYSSRRIYHEPAVKLDSNFHHGFVDGTDDDVHIHHRFQTSITPSYSRTDGENVSPLFASNRQ